MWRAIIIKYLTGPRSISGWDQRRSESYVREITFTAWINSMNKALTTNVILSCEIKVKWSRYRPGVAQRVGRGIALLFHDGGTRRGWVVNSTPRQHFTPGKDSVPILQEAGWAPEPVPTGGKSRPHRDSIPNRTSRSQSLYRLSQPAHLSCEILVLKHVPKDFCE